MKKAADESQANITARIESLEAQIAYMDDALENQNKEMARLHSELKLTKEALQHVYSKLTGLMEGTQDAGSNPADEPPPPHY